MMKKIFLSSLCACALAGVAAINVPTHAPLRKGGVIVSGSAEAMPHTGYSALIATEKGGYEPLEVALRGVATPETGSFRLHYYPHFTTPGAKVVLTSGMKREPSCRAESPKNAGLDQSDECRAKPEHNGQGKTKNDGIEHFFDRQHLLTACF